VSFGYYVPPLKNKFKEIDSSVRFRAKFFLAACRVACFAALQLMGEFSPGRVTPQRWD
jgi:hypothetical protein